MNNRIDHAAEAVTCLKQAHGKYTEQAQVLMAQAQVHATIALVEQQRLANLTTLATLPSDSLSDDLREGAVRALINPGAGWRPEVAAALGIEAADSDE